MADRHKSEPFSAVDAAWLHMEEPTSMAMITGVMMFDQPISFRRLQATITARLLPYERFTQHVREPNFGLGLPRWEADPHFDLNAHLHHYALPAPGDQASLQNLVGDLMSTPLDFSKPLWQMHLIEDFGAGCALVIRLHHCIADGLALMQVLLSLADADPNLPWPTLPQALAPRRRGWVGRRLHAAAHLVRSTHRTLRAAETLLHEGLETLVHRERLLHAARLGVKGTKALGKLLLIGPDQRTILKGHCGVTKRAAWSQSIPLDEVKGLAQTMGGTINDVVLTAVAGALGRYLVSHGQPLEGVNIRAVIPVNLRGEDELDTLGNRFGLVFLSLPIGVRDPLRRLQILKQRMDQIKDTPEAVVAFGILNAMGLSPLQIQRVIVDLFAMKATAVMTNVPGPRQPLYLAGSRIRSMMFWVPSPGDLALGVSIYSFAGEVVVGIASDACVISEPQQIIDDFHAELAAMRAWCDCPPPAEAAALEPSETEEVTLSVPATAGALAPARCQALTRRGAPCKNFALPDGPFCRRHEDLQADRQPR